MCEPRYIVQGFDEVPHELTLSPRAGILTFLRRALAIVIVFRSQSEVSVTLAGQIRVAAAAFGCCVTRIRARRVARAGECRVTALPIPLTGARGVVVVGPHRILIG